METIKMAGTPGGRHFTIGSVDVSNAVQPIFLFFIRSFFLFGFPPAFQSRSRRENQPPGNSSPFDNTTFLSSMAFEPFFAWQPRIVIWSPVFTVSFVQLPLLDSMLGLWSSPCHFSILPC